MEISEHLRTVSFSRESVKSPPALGGSNWFHFSGSRPNLGLPRSALPGHVRLGLTRDSRAGVGGSGREPARWPGFPGTFVREEAGEEDPWPS